MIRTAETNDVPSALATKTRGWRDSYSNVVSSALLSKFADHWLPEMYAAVDDPDAFLDVAIEGADVIGITQGTYLPTAYLASLHVLPEHRGLGIGTRLIAQVGRDVQARGHSRLELDVVTTNTKAIAFYERLGATTIGEHPASWAPAVIESRMVVADIQLMLRLVQGPANG